MLARSCVLAGKDWRRARDGHGAACPSAVCRLCSARSTNNRSDQGNDPSVRGGLTKRNDARRSAGLGPCTVSFEVRSLSKRSSALKASTTACTVPP